LTIFQRAKLSTPISAGAIEGHFEGKRRGKVTKVVSFLQDNTPAHRTLATQKELTYFGFIYLDHPPVPWTEKQTIERSPFFVQLGGHHCREDLVGRTC